MDIKWEGKSISDNQTISKEALEGTKTPMWTGPVNAPVDKIVTMISKGDLTGAKRQLSKMYKIMPGQIVLHGDYNIFNALSNIIFLEEEKQERTRQRMRGVIY